MEEQNVSPRSGTLMKLKGAIHGTCSSLWTYVGLVLAGNLCLDLGTRLCTPLIWTLARSVSAEGDFALVLGVMALTTGALFLYAFWGMTLMLLLRGLFRGKAGEGRRAGRIAVMIFLLINVIIWLNSWAEGFRFFMVDMSMGPLVSVVVVMMAALAAIPAVLLCRRMARQDPRGAEPASPAAPTPWEALCLSPGASAEEIRQAFERHRLFYEPLVQKEGAEGEAARKRFGEIWKAYQDLRRGGFVS